jgi:hypothetical protein
MWLRLVFISSAADSSEAFDGLATARDDTAGGHGASVSDAPELADVVRPQIGVRRRLRMCQQTSPDHSAARVDRRVAEQDQGRKVTKVTAFRSFQIRNIF